MLVASVWTSCPCWSTPAHIRRPPCTLGRLPRRLSHSCTLSKVSTACCTRGLLIFSDKTTKTRSKNVRHSVWLQILVGEVIALLVFLLKLVGGYTVLGTHRWSLHCSAASARLGYQYMKQSSMWCRFK